MRLLFRSITTRRRTTSDDSLSVVLFNDKENLSLEMQEMKEDIVERIFQYVTAGGTNYSSGLKLAGRYPPRFVNSVG
jgi:septum formation topological specificity factor MinE